jgi:hypothetical protein
MELNSLLLMRREHAPSEGEAAGEGENLAVAVDASGSWDSVVNRKHKAAGCGTASRIRCLGWLRHMC